MKMLAVIKSGDSYIANGVVMNNGNVSETYNNTVVCKEIADSLKAMPKDMAGGFFGTVIKAPATSKTVTLDIPDDIGQQLVDKYKVMDDKSELFGRAPRRNLDQVKTDIEKGIAEGTVQLQDNLRDKKNGGKVWKRKDASGNWVSLTKTELMFVPDQCD